VAGSVSANATELYGEGLRIPPVKVFRAGRLQADVLKLIMSNLRVPNEREGDMRAQIAANELGKRRLRALVEKYGRETVLGCAEEFKDYSERRVRAEIERIPDGTYEFFDFMDNDGVEDGLVRFAAAVTVRGSDMTIDLSGSAPQRRGPVNSPLANTIAAVLVAVQHFLNDPRIPLTEGTYRPIRVIAPEGSVVNPRFPAPCGSVTGSSRRIIWTVLGALGQAVPLRMTGSNFGSMCDIGISGVDPRSGERFVIYAIVEGGWGARRDRDGMSAMRNLMGQIMNTPAELFEVHEPLFVERVALRVDSGGPGTFRGGLGVVREYRALTACDVAIALDRCLIGPWGFAGGKSGLRMEVEIHRADGEVISVAAMGGKVSGLRLQPGDALVILSPGGGGWGPPYARDVERVERDVRYGYVSPERALRDYGVAIDPRSLAVDPNATREARSRLRAQQRPNELYGFDVEMAEIDELNRSAYPRAVANGLEEGR
jgi:N-methylhydantoinase B